jgi:hypothetical protein
MDATKNSTLMKLGKLIPDHTIKKKDLVLPVIVVEQCIRIFSFSKDTKGCPTTK